MGTSFESGSSVNRGSSYKDKSLEPLPNNRDHLTVDDSNPELKGGNQC